MRAEEAVSVWRAEYKHIEHPFSGMEFLTSGPVVMKMKVFDVLHRVSPGQFFYASRASVLSESWCVGCRRGHCYMHIWTLPSTSTSC